MTSKLEFALKFYVAPKAADYKATVSRLQKAVAKGPSEVAYFLSFNNVAKAAAYANVAADVTERATKWANELDEEAAFDKVYAYCQRQGLADTAGQAEREFVRQAYAKVARDFADA